MNYKGSLIYTKKAGHEERKETVNEVLTVREQSISDWKTSRDRTREVRRYINHDPYSTAEKASANANNKPLMRYAVVISKITTVVGNESGNRREVTFNADSWEHENEIALLKKNFDFLQKREKLEDLLLSQLTDGLLYPTGGWIRRYIESDKKGYLTYKWRRWDTLDVHPDGKMKMNDLSDCRFIVWDDWMSWDEIRFLASKSSFTELNQDWWKQLESWYDPTVENTTEYKDGDRYLVCQQEEIRETPVTVVMMEGSFLTVTDKELGKLAKGSYQVIREISEKRVFITTIVPGANLVIEKTEYALPVTRLSGFVCFSYNFHIQKTKQASLAYLMLDVQDRINKGKSQEVDYITQQLSNVWHVDKKETEAIKQLQVSAGEPTSVVPYKNINNRAVRDSGAVNSASISTIQNGVMGDLNFLQEVSNITAAMEGKKGNSAESGVLYDSKVSQGLRATNIYYEAKARVAEEIASDYLQTVPFVYFEDDRVIETSAEYHGGLGYEIVNLKYDEENIKNNIRQAVGYAELDASASTPNRLEEVFNQNMVFVRTLLDAGYPPEQIDWSLLVKHSTLKDKQLWIDMMSKGQRIMQNKVVENETNDKMTQMMDIEQRTNQSAKA